MSKADCYAYHVFWSEEDGEFVATCAEFPGLSWLDGSPEKALSGMREVVAGCIQDLKAAGETVPEPIIKIDSEDALTTLDKLQRKLDTGGRKFTREEMNERGHIP